MPICRTELKHRLASNEFAWFFLSAGYGLIHGLEPAMNYRATFTRTIAHNNCIPFTAGRWKRYLTEIIDSALSRLGPEQVFLFGSQDYSFFFKESKTWRNAETKAQLFESTGSAGPHWLSPLIGNLARAVLNDDVVSFAKPFDRYNKQQI
jgi:hypothetical protein